MYNDKHTHAHVHNTVSIIMECDTSLSVYVGVCMHTDKNTIHTLSRNTLILQAARCTGSALGSRSSYVSTKKCRGIPATPFCAEKSVLKQFTQKTNCGNKQNSVTCVSAAKNQTDNYVTNREGYNWTELMIYASSVHNFCDVYRLHVMNLCLAPGW